MEQFKIIKEYDRFYLCEHPKGYKECFNKSEYKPTEDGYIEKEESNFIGRPGEGLNSKKVNHNFNPSVLFKKN